MKRRLVAGALAALELFLAGGLVALLLVRQLLVAIMLRLTSAAAQAELLNVLDHLLPYLMYYLLATVVVGLLAGLACLWVSAGRVRTSTAKTELTSMSL